MNRSRELWLGSSWKMNKLLDEALAFASALKGATTVVEGLNRFVLPPFTVAREVAASLENSPIWVGGQNIHWDDAGAWTGEISGPMLLDCGLSMVAIGHSDRRKHFGETNTLVTRKVEAAKRNGLLPIVCVGETAQERAAGRTEEVLVRQVDAALQGLGKTPVIDRDAPAMLVAYEPVWAIGTSGQAFEPTDIAASITSLATHIRRASPRYVSLLYGGGVSRGNASAILSLPDVDGLFVGRAAWTLDGFLALVDIAARHCEEKVPERSF